IFLPLTLLSFHAAKLVFVAFLFAALAGIVAVTGRLVRGDRRYLLLLVIAMASSRVLYVNFLVAQVGIFFTLLVTWTPYQVERDRNGSSGWSVGLLVLKPMLILGPLAQLAIKRNWQACAIAIVVAAILFFAPFLYVGLGAIQDYRAVTASATSDS